MHEVFAARILTLQNMPVVKRNILVEVLTARVFGLCLEMEKKTTNFLQMRIIGNFVSTRNTSGWRTLYDPDHCVFISTCSTKTISIFFLAVMRPNHI